MTRMTIAGLLLIGLAAAAAAAQEPPPSMKSAASAAAPVNLNTATAQQLETLPGIGAATAQRIPAGGAFLRTRTKQTRRASPSP